jgi:fumarate hydratase subunit beta
MKKIELPLNYDLIDSLKIGDELLLSGKIYTARDVAHKRLAQLIKYNRKLPIDLKWQTIYYAGPTPALPGKIIGACGPTTSSRMDSFTPSLLSYGLKGMIGKGRRSEEVRESIKKHNAVYFVAIGGAGAYLSERIKKSKVVLYEDLGPEAVFELEIKDFPVIVGIDSDGNDIYSRD